jgi:hypothetical protein
MHADGAVLVPGQNPPGEPLPAGGAEGPDIDVRRRTGHSKTRTARILSGEFVSPSSVSRYVGQHRSTQRHEPAVTAKDQAWRAEASPFSESRH